MPEIPNELTISELTYTRDALRRRVRELKKKLERTSYDGKPGMKDAVVKELKGLESAIAKIEEPINAWIGRISKQLTP